MRTIKILFFLFLALSMNLACSAQIGENKDVKTKSTDRVEVYYFHFDRRCMTCRSVENTARVAVSEMNNNEVNFSAYNLDKAEGQQKGEEIGIAGQTLIIVSGDTQINITNEGFMNARNPEKLKQMIQDKIDPLL
ncbi:MAG: hypothetical protein GVY19_09930 [Bacteroidetes bacterium]|jgi:hypothetical protein|nr:hypothetical protein [Bacteroidota bacterium]